ncbi:MAG: c-type cytochrome [Pseudohongiellaceae bacterium]
MKRILIAAVALGGLGLQTAHAQDAEQMLQQKACVACHATDVQLVGPAYKAVAEKYSGEDGAVDTLVDSIMNGSEGKWGQIPMPPNAVTEEEATALAEWVLEQG